MGKKKVSHFSTIVHLKIKAFPKEKKYFKAISVASLALCVK